MRSKTSFSIFAIIICILILVIYKYNYYNTNDNNSFFKENKQKTAQKLYNNISSLDFKKEYPISPENVMKVQCDILMLLYGNMIQDDTLYSEILKIQRNLFSNELLENNSFESQYSKFKEEIKNLDNNKIFCISIDYKPAVYNQYNNKYATVEVDQVYSILGKIKTSYNLEKKDIDNKWKIASWEVIDSDLS